MSNNIPIQFTHRNGSASDALNQLTEEKFARLYKLAPNMTDVKVIFNTEGLVHTVEAEIHLPGTKPICARAQTDDMYKSVDALVPKLARQLEKYKELHLGHQK